MSCIGMDWKTRDCGGWRMVLVLWRKRTWQPEEAKWWRRSPGPWVKTLSLTSQCLGKPFPSFHFSFHDCIMNNLHWSPSAKGPDVGGCSGSTLWTSIGPFPSPGFLTLSPDLSQVGSCWGLSSKEHNGGNESNKLITETKPIRPLLERSKILFI